MAIIKIMRDGPYVILGDEVQVLDQNGTPYTTRTRTVLCRCGASGKKPFCDGTHSTWDSSRRMRQRQAITMTIKMTERFDRHQLKL
ncbi:MAG: CDGSH iron-sulfur domain-containing protein [Steroidobacteraceae bacterium]